MARALHRALIVWVAACGFAAAAPPAARAQDTVLKSFGAGDTLHSVGIGASETGEDKEEDGPQALAVSDTGKLFLLDQLNGRILTFDPSNPGADPQAFTLPKDVLPTDLVVKGNDIYVWDGKVHALQALGAENAPTRSLTETRSDEPIDDATLTAFAQMGSQPAGVAPDPAGVSTRGVTTVEKPPALAHQTVETRQHGTVVADIRVTDQGAGAELDVRTKAKAAVAPKLHLRVRDRLGTVAFLGLDKTGRLFVLAENVPDTISSSAFAFVARFTPKGGLDGFYELPLSESSTVSRRFVTLSPDGDIYFLKSRKGSVDVLGLGFRATPNAKVVEHSRPQPNYAAQAWAARKPVNMAVGPLTRQRVIQTAYAFEGLRWTVAPSNYGPPDDVQCSGFNGRIRRPMYLINKEGQEVHSVPYCWGCQGSLNQFAQRVQQGALAGNVCTRNNPRPDVVGVDCSSFVSAAWGLSTHFSTAAIPEITTPVGNPWAMLPGDAFNKPGSHVMLFLNYTADRQAEVMEASPGACAGRVCRSIYPMSSLLEHGYIPVRYRALMDAQN